MNASTGASGRSARPAASARCAARRCCDTLGGEPSGQRVECCADLVKFANPLGVDPGDDQPAAAVFFDQLLLLEQLQRVADWLPRHTKGAAQLLLADALPGGERAVGDRFDQLLIGTVDQCRLGVEMLHPGTTIEFGILP
jgi:hypothetical protein